ncbi:MAG TPA: carbohydrate kinase family protein [Opitutales bacterium]|nr:carbohydrate kinase family protein [Opitutales bacterium]
MEHKNKTLSELEKCAEKAASVKAVVGIDGFVDKIVHPVDKRNGPGDDFQRIPTISEFGSRISSAAGKSANIELAPVVEKLGGNGPIMANAQAAHGLQVRYIGALGEKAIHSVFSEFAIRTGAVSIADPGISHCAEFKDGKIIFGSMASLEAITYEHIVELVGEDALESLFSGANLIAMVNWTMIPFLTEVFKKMLSDLLPKLPEDPERTFFFDLADPEKRSSEDLKEVLHLFKEFEDFGKVILGLNYREAEQVDGLLGHDPMEKTPKNLQTLAARIREELEIDTVVVHPVECAACATPDGTAFAKGPLCDDPKITTGAGDHFNSGFVTGRLIGLSPEASLTLAVATSGHYVRTAVSPTLDDLAKFIRSWE